MVRIINLDNQSIRGYFCALFYELGEWNEENLSAEQSEKKK